MKKLIKYTKTTLNNVIRASHIIGTGRYNMEDVDALTYYEQTCPYTRRFLTHCIVWVSLSILIFSFAIPSFGNLQDGWTVDNLQVLVNITVGYMFFTFGLLYLTKRIFPAAIFPKYRVALLYIISILCPGSFMFLLAFTTNCFPFPYILPISLIFYLIIFILCLHFILGRLISYSKRELWNFYHVIILQFEIAIVYAVFAGIYKLAAGIYTFYAAAGLIILRCLMEYLCRRSLERCACHIKGKESSAMLSTFIAVGTNSAYTIQCIQYSKTTVGSIQIALADVVFAVLHSITLHMEMKDAKVMKQELNKHGVHFSAKRKILESLLCLSDCPTKKISVSFKSDESTRESSSSNNHLEKKVRRPSIVPLNEAVVCAVESRKNLGPRRGRSSRIIEVTPIEVFEPKPPIVLSKPIILPKPSVSLKSTVQPKESKQRRSRTFAKGKDKDGILIPVKCAPRRSSDSNIHRTFHRRLSMPNTVVPLDSPKPTLRRIATVLLSSKLLPTLNDDVVQVTNAYVKQQLRILMFTEYIALVRYIKFMVPLAFYILAELRRFTSDVDRSENIAILNKHSKEANIIRLNNYYFIGTQGILAILSLIHARFYVDYSLITQVSFIVSKNKIILIFIFAVWMTYMETFSVPHFGNDVTFRQICLNLKNHNKTTA